MAKLKYLDLDEFQEKLDQFVFLPTYTKLKHQYKNEFDKFLGKHKMVIINVKPNSKYNYCTKTHSFTIFKVPEDKLGKLFNYRSKWVLIRCDSSSGGSWGYYWNEVFELKKSVENLDLNNLKQKYKEYFIINNE
jgi:hypothetical protein